MPQPAARSSRPSGMVLVRAMPALSTQPSATIVTPAAASRLATGPVVLDASAADRLERAAVLRSAMGDPLLEAFLAVRPRRPPACSRHWAASATPPPAPSRQAPREP
jgi:hypothetical protein